jgi:DNA-3-methyladenine glycosylase
MSIGVPSPSAELGDRLDRSFFERSVHDVAVDLVGCALTYRGAGGIIVETESYEAADPACHAFGGITARNRVLFGPPAVAYVYFSYGVHSLLNAVAEPEGSAAAVLIRALEPRFGVEAMRRRRRQRELTALCSGPGKLTEALGIGLDANGVSLLKEPFELRARAAGWREVEVVAGPRVGISHATELPWRFCAAASPFLSRRAG